MKLLFRLLCLLGLVLCVNGCCGYHADYPWKYTPPRHTHAWEPNCGIEIPIPANRLIDPYVCIGACENTECLALPQLVDLALRNSYKTQETWADARYAAAQWGIAQAPLYPELQFQTHYSEVHFSSLFANNLSFTLPSGQTISFPDTYRTYGPRLQFGYLLFDWGTTCKESEALWQTLLQANWTHNQEIQNVVRTVLTDYYEYLASRAHVEASQANLENALVALDATESKHEQGISDLSDVLNAKTEVAKQDTKYLRNQQIEADYLSRLITDLSIPANTPLCIEGTLTVKKEETCSLDFFLAQAYLSRPDLFAANADVQSQMANVQAAIRNQFPKLHFRGEVGRFYGSFSGGGSTDYYLELALKFPLFKGFEYINQVRSATAQLEYAKASMKQLELTIINEVVQSYQNLVFAKQKVNVGEAYVNIAEQSFTATLSKYREGTVDFTTLANSLTNLADARFSLVSSKRDWLTSLTELAYATGILWGTPCNG